MQRLGAVPARAHRDAGAIQQGRQVMRMRIVEGEGEDAATILRAAEQAEPVDIGQPAHRMIDQPPLMRLDRRHADRCDVVDRSVQANGLDDCRRAGLELRRRRRPFAALEGHHGDHVAAAEEGRHALLVLEPRPEHADPRRTVQLVAGEGVEIRPQRLHVDAAMDRGLAAVEQDLGAMGMGERHQPLGRRHGAEHVRHVGDGDQPDLAVGELRLDIGHVELAGIGDVGDAQLDAMGVAQHLPGDDVGVVLERADQHGLPGLHDAAAPAMGDEVHRLGAVPGEDHLARIASVDEARDGAAGGLVILGRRLAQPIGAAMDIGVAALHAADHGVNHGARLLRRGAAVEEHQVLAADLLRQDREIGADAGEVEAHAAPRHQVPTAASTAARAVGSVTPSTASCRKASIRIERACASGIPRARR